MGRIPLEQRPPESSSGLAHQQVSTQIILPKDAVQICQACHEARACPNALVCCGGLLQVNILVPCPNEKWSPVDTGDKTR